MFSESLYRYGYRAGLLFAERQEQAYCGRQAAELVDWLRAAKAFAASDRALGGRPFLHCAPMRLRQRNLPLAYENNIHRRHSI